MRWNGSVMGRRHDNGRGLWYLRAQGVLRQANDWPYPVNLPIMSNLILWIDPSNASSVTLNGATVSSILDLSSSAKTVNQTTAANQPEYIVNAKNGLNAMRHIGGIQQFLSITSTAIPASHTVFTVIRRPIAAIESHGIGGGTSQLFPFTWFTDNLLYTASNGSLVSVGSASTATGWFYITSRRNGTTQIRLRRNGTTVGDVTSGTAVTNAASGNWTHIGYRGGVYNNSEVGEIIAYDTNLSDSDVDSVESYLATKWGI